MEFDSALMIAGLVLNIEMDDKDDSRLVILLEFKPIYLSASIMFTEFYPMSKVFWAMF